MKIKSTLIFIIVFWVNASVVAETNTTKVVKAQLDAVTGNQVVFNGRSYPYRIDLKASVLALDESESESLKKHQLNVGDFYFFELYSSKKEAKSGDFSKVVFISKQYQGGEE